MAPPAKDKTRKRKRKARTDVSSLSSSSSESEAGKSPSPPPQPQDQEQPGAQKSSSSFRGLSSDPGPTRSSSPPKCLSADSPRLTQPQSPEKAFEGFYLQQATKEFANDIDKLRSAPDFHERYVPVLVQALRQGTGCFSREERGRVGGAAVQT